MAYCGKCGTKVDEGVKFCPSCGNPMEAPAPEQQAQTQQAQPARRSERLLGKDRCSQQHG